MKMFPVKDDKIRINYRNKIDGLLLLLFYIEKVQGKFWLLFSFPSRAFFFPFLLYKKSKTSSELFSFFLLEFNHQITPQKSQSITYYTFQKSIYFLLLSVTFLFDWSINVLFDLISFCIVYKCVVDYVFYPFGRKNEGNLIFRFEVGHSCKLIYKRLD